ncbi:hypothetical protein DR96_3166 [Providencia stuartii]|nr:hypothetical protein DR96_3166 [Providencia stuartii]
MMGKYLAFISFISSCLDKNKRKISVINNEKGSLKINCLG